MKKTIIGHNLRLLRKKRGLSQRELAETLGLKRNNIASYEAGIVEPRADTFIRLAEFFSVDPARLLTEEFQPRPAHALAPAAPAPPSPALPVTNPEPQTPEINRIIADLKARDDGQFAPLILRLEQLLESNRSYPNRTRQDQEER